MVTLSRHIATSPLVAVETTLMGCDCVSECLARVTRQTLLDAAVAKVMKRKRMLQ